MKNEKISNQDQAARDRIVSAAIRLFSRVPVGMTTISEIAREAEVKQPLLMYHFKTKDRLHHEILVLAVDRMQYLLKEYFAEFENKKHFCTEEARKLLAEIICVLIDGTYPADKGEGAWMKILLFEVCYPSEYFQELYERFFSRFYIMVAGIIMAINPTYDFNKAVLQWMQIYGLILSHQVEHENVKRFTGFKGQSPKERDMFKELVIQNAFLMLETESNLSIPPLGP